MRVRNTQYNYTSIRKNKRKDVNSYLSNEHSEAQWSSGKSSLGCQMLCMLCIRRYFTKWFGLSNSIFSVQLTKGTLAKKILNIRHNIGWHMNQSTISEHNYHHMVPQTLEIDWFDITVQFKLAEVCGIHYRNCGKKVSLCTRLPPRI